MKFQGSSIHGQQLLSVGNHCRKDMISINVILSSGDDDSLQNVGQNYVVCSQPKNMDLNRENNSTTMNDQAMIQNQIMINRPSGDVERTIFLRTSKVLLNLFVHNFHI